MGLLLCNTVGGRDAVWERDQSGVSLETDLLCSKLTHLEQLFIKLQLNSKAHYVVLSVFGFLAN